MASPIGLVRLLIGLYEGAAPGAQGTIMLHELGT